MKHVYSNYMLIINKESTPSLCPSLTTMLLMAGTFSHLSFNIEGGGGGGGLEFYTHKNRFAKSSPAFKSFCNTFIPVVASMIR